MLIGSSQALIETWVFLKLWFSMSLAYKDDVSDACRKSHHVAQARLANVNVRHANLIVCFATSFMAGISDEGALEGVGRRSEVASQGLGKGRRQERSCWQRGC